MDPLTQNQKWSCGYCTYENWPATKKCVLCRAPKPPQYIDEDVPIEQDIYKMAPLVYPDSIGPCSSSTHTTSSTTQPVVSSDPASTKWTCQTCTYLNWPKASKCTQCLTVRPRSANAGSSVSPTQPLSIDVNIAESSVSAKNSPSSPEAAKAINNDKNRAVATVVPRSSNPPPAALVSKWPCRSCTYENWMRSLRCVLCGVPRSEGVVAGLQRETTGEKESNRSGGGKKKQRRSPMSSMHNLVDTIESFHHPGGATASPSIHLERQQQIHPQQQTIQTESFSSNIRKKDDRKMRQFRNRLRDLNWLWLNACQGVVNGDPHAVEAYLASGGDPTRQLTANESELLSRPSAFTVGHTLIHLALRFNREDILSALLATPEAASKARKRVPSYVAPDLAAEIVRDIARALRQRKGDFPCYFLTDYSTFALPTDVEDLPNEVRKQLFEELLDCNVQKELEDDEPVINWSSEITDRLGSRLYPLWNRTAGDCLLDSVLQACWGIMDRDNTLRHALADSLNEGAMLFYRRWKETESIEAELLNFSLEESQWEQEWAELLSLASQPGASLEQVHIFALAHILRRPIIVYGIKFVKSYHGDNIDLARFQGVYLPLFWEQSFCWHVPIALGYTRGHFAALVPMEVDIFATTTGAQANISNNDDDDDDDDDVPIAYLPLMDYEGKVLPIHFLQPSEIGHEQSLLSEWLDCCFTEGGLLVAKQRLTKPPILVRQMVDEWLQRYRSVTNAHIHVQHQQQHQQHQQSSHASITPSSMITPSLLPSVVLPIAPRTTTTSPSGGEGLSSDDDTDDE